MELKKFFFLKEELPVMALLGMFGCLKVVKFLESIYLSSLNDGVIFSVVLSRRFAGPRWQGPSVVGTFTQVSLAGGAALLVF